MLDKAIEHAAATETRITPLTRFDSNISNGIVYTIKEYSITDTIIALHKNSGNESDFFGSVAQNILQRTFQTIFIYKSVQPFNTLKRIVVAITPDAETEDGFEHWLNRLSILAKEAALPLVLYSTRKTSFPLKAYFKYKTLQVEYHEFGNWDDFLIFSRELKLNDLFFIITSRKGNSSYHPVLEKLPYYLKTYFSEYSFILLYPKQTGHELNPVDLESETGLIETLSSKIPTVNKAGSFIKKLFR